MFARATVLVDGSAQAQQAFLTAVECSPFAVQHGSNQGSAAGTPQASETSLTVVHVSDSRKAGYLPHDLQPEAIVADYEAQLRDKARGVSSSVVCEDCAEFGPAQEAVTAILRATVKPTFVLAGSVGRKGPKPADPSALGATARALLEAAECPVYLAKPFATAQSPRASRLYMVCVDGSDAAHEAFVLASQLLRPQDALAALFVAAPAQAQATSPQLQSADIGRRYGEIARADRRVTFAEVPVPNEAQVAPTILAKAQELVAYAVLMGITGATTTEQAYTGVPPPSEAPQSKLGAVVAAVVERVSCSVGVCPPPSGSVVASRPESAAA